ncbi:MAG: asparagine synthase (glutamine-hydrolyzing) [Alphaproteobacteria bacterium]|nr:asparagine synthase (glutamine-hydrolyzing) [Alphaproteobacteria bacterium]
MCGIAGFISRGSGSSKAQDIPSLVSNMLSEIHHRGPDESGLFHNDFLALGTVRLSIIDIKNGQQPMMAQDRYVLNFNGEVFNYVELRAELETFGHKFLTKSDTEVVLHSLIQWGPDALSKFDGHFAISFYDKLEDELLLARDPFGEKPLFYTHQEDFFAFGSEIKTFRAISDFDFALDQKSLSHTAWFWTSLPGQSMFKHVKSVRSGHFLKYRRGEITEHRYFDYPELTQDSSISYEDAKEQLRAIMTKSIKRRLRSDIEVASYLSGGLDSTIVTCLAQEMVGDSLKTFSVAFDNPDYDESEFQESVASHLGTEHHALKISNQDIVTNFSNVVEHAETALFRTALTPLYLLSQNVNKNGIKVVLTGEGSDEFFMGYDIFKETLFRENYYAFSDDEARIEEILGLYPYLPHFDEKRAQQLLQYFKNYTDQDTAYFSHDLRFANGRLANQLLNNSFAKEDVDQDLQSQLAKIAGFNFADQSKLAQAQILDIKLLLEGYLLSSQGDRMTSANSVEGRCPFLNVELVKFAQSLPLEMKLDQGLEKKILREAFADQIPKASSERRKQPYRAPDVLPFVKDPDYMRDQILEGLLPNSDIINPDMAKRFVTKLISKEGENISPREDQAFIFMLSTLMLEQKFAVVQTDYSTTDINLKVVIDDTNCRKSA